MSTGDVGLKDFLKRRRRRGATLFHDRTARRPRTAISRALFSVLSIAADVVAITLSAIVTGIAYHDLYYHVGGMFQTFAALGISVAVLFVVLSSFNQEYALASYLNLGANTRRAIFVWNTTFLTTLIVFFITKESAQFSRASMLLFYFTGLVSLVALRCTIV